MNKIILRGRPTDSPKIYRNSKEGENGETKESVMSRFTIASNRMYVREGGREADFIPCVAYGRQAKTIENYVQKGSHILITGRLENNDYEKDGQTIYGFQVVIDTIELLDKKENSDEEFHPAEETPPFGEVEG